MKRMRPQETTRLTLRERARAMRAEPAPAEQLLWSRIRGDQLKGCRFRRQYRIDSYIVDFYCPAVKLVIELDGDSHADRVEYDSRRSEILKSHGCTVIRFVNESIFENLDAVIDEIDSKLTALLALLAPGPSPLPSPRVLGEGEASLAC